MLAVGLVAVPSAMGQAADVDSDTNIGLNPNWLPEDGPAAKVDLFAQVRNVDANGSGPVGNIHAQEVEKVNMHFDDSITFTTARHPECNNDVGPPVTSLEGATTQQALDRCGKAQIGSGNASVRFPVEVSEDVFVAVQADLTVTTFLGNPTTAGGGFDGGQPEILLHANVNAGGPPLPIVVVVGELTNSDLGADFGRELNVPDAPDVGGSNPGDGALVLFNSTIGKTFKFRKGRKRITRNLVTARCDDANQLINISTRFEFDDASNETDTSGQNCGVKP